MPFIDEKRLSANIKNDKLSPLYFLFGEEIFLTETYVQRIIKKIIGSDYTDFDFCAFNGSFSSEELEESVEGMPLSCDKKLVLITDYDADKDSTDEFNKKLVILSDIPDFCVVVLVFKDISIEVKKLKSKMKKIFSLAEKNGEVCEFKHMTPSKVADLVVKRFAKRKIEISKENALFLSQLCKFDLSQIGTEADKLAAFSLKSGVVDRKAIEQLVPKQPEEKVFALADSILSGNSRRSYEILDDLLWQRIEPIVIVSVLSGAYIDYYRANLAIVGGVNPKQVAIDFSYPKNKEFLIVKAYNKARSINQEYIKNSIRTLFIADNKLKTTAIDSRIVLEEMLARLLAVKK